MSWHASEQLLDRYAHDRVDVVTAASLEAHLLACDPCRRTLAEVGAASLEESIERAWSDIVDTLDQPKLSLVERLLRRVGVADGDAKVIATAPSLRLSWLGAVALAVAFAVWAARNGPRDPIVFLTLAPFVPLAGVAVAFGPIADPMHETILASPISATRILAMRSLAVGVISATILLPATLILAVSHPIAAAWIAPALAVVSLALCLAPRMGLERGAAVAGSMWGLAVPSALLLRESHTAPTAGHLFLFALPMQVCFFALTMIGLVYVWLHRDALAAPSRWESGR